MYIPKSKYSEPKHSRGDFLFKKDGTPYVGWYIKTYNDRYLTGKVPSNTTKELTIVSEEPYTREFTFTLDIIAPKQGDYVRGYFTRYVLQDRRNLKIIEVQQDKYYYLIKETHIKGIELNWVIKGPAKDLVKPPYIYQGAETKNKQTIEIQDNLIKGLKEYIKDYGKFVE
jgi:hypothetical protein